MNITSTEIVEAKLNSVAEVANLSATAATAAPPPLQPVQSNQETCFWLPGSHKIDLESWLAALISVITMG